MIALSMISRVTFGCFALTWSDEGRTAGKKCNIDTQKLESSGTRVDLRLYLLLVSDIVNVVCYSCRVRGALEVWRTVRTFRTLFGAGSILGT